jgi:hypothetical protein
MRKIFALLMAAAMAGLIAVPATAVGPTVGTDARVTRHTYVRHDGGTDAAIQVCNSKSPPVYGNNTVNNEPFSVVNPQNPNLIIAGWNDYCSDWMGLGFSTDAGKTWTNSLVPGYPADTSAEGVASPEYIRTNNASDPLGAFDSAGHFYFGAISYNGFAGPKTNADVWVARYDVVDPSTNGGYPLDYLATTRVGQGTPSANFFGRFLDKPMLEVDRTGGPRDGNVYMCFTKFPGSGQSEIYFAASGNQGRTFTKPIAISGRNSGQGCDIAIEHDGDVHVSWRDFETSSSKKNFGVSAVRSADGGLTFSKPVKVATLPGYNPFDGARDCGDGPDACPSGFVFGRVPLEPRLTADPTGELPGIYSIVQASDPATITPSASSYSSVGAPSASGLVAQGAVYIMRSLDDGRTWSAPYRVDANPVGHQFFPDADALAGRLVVVWQDSRTDPCYGVQRPVGNTTAATSCGTGGLNTYTAVSTNGTTFATTMKVSSKGNQPQYEMFDAADVPFLGDYNWVNLVERPNGSLFGYMAWTDNRDVVPGDDPREATQDGFDVESGWQLQPDGTYTREFNLGGYDQNIYGNSIVIP